MSATGHVTSSAGAVDHLYPAPTSIMALDCVGPADARRPRHGPERERFAPATVFRPGPSIVAVLDRADDGSTATTELWMPIELASVG